jgi:hypothetical protein
MNIAVVLVLISCVIALAIVTYLKNKAQNRRIDRYNRNVDRHNQMMEMLLKDKQEGSSNTDNTEKTE